MSVYKFLDLSVEHITPNDAQYLSLQATITKIGAKAPTLVVYEFDRGFFVSVPPADTFADTVLAMRQSWCSGHLIALLERARQEGCILVQLDRDAAVCEGLDLPDLRKAG